MTYLVLANEDEFGEEKYPEFVTPGTLLSTKETPPSTAELYKDYVDLMFTDGDFGDRSSDTDTVKTSCGDITTTDYTPGREPNLTIECDFKRLGYLLGRFQDFKTVYNGDPTDPSAKDDVWMVVGNQSLSTKSDTIYTKRYDDAEYVNTGFQISELSYDISDKGMIDFTLSGISAYERLGIDRDKNFGVCAATILKTDHIVNVYIKELLPGYVPSIDEDLSSWEQIGCTLNSLSLSLTQDMDEDSFSPCGMFNNGKPVRKAGKKGISSKENTFESESKQSDSKWLRFYFGGKGSIEFIKNRNFALMIVYQTPDAQLRQVLPNVKIIPGTPSMSIEDPTESLTITMGYGGVKYPITATTYNEVNTDIATYYNGQGGVSMASIAYARIENNANALAGKTITIRTNDGSNTLQQYYKFKSNDTDLNIPLYTGEYTLRAYIEGTGEINPDDFTLLATHTETNPLVIVPDFTP